jgi:hypothetical protein
MIQELENIWNISQFKDIFSGISWDVERKKIKSIQIKIHDP